jgi:hypothetical protein
LSIKNKQTVAGQQPVGFKRCTALLLTGTLGGNKTQRNALPAVHSKWAMLAVTDAVTEQAMVAMGSGIPRTWLNPFSPGP